MNEEEIKLLWKNTNKQLEESLQLQQQKAQDIAQIKAGNLLASMRPAKQFAVIAGLLWVVAGAILLTPIYLYGFATANKYFLFSASLQVLLTAIALVLYLYQLSAISHIDWGTPVLQTQRRLIRIRSASLWIARMLCLQLPLWTTFYWNREMLTNGSYGLWALQAFVTMGCTVLALWLFTHIRYKNRHQKWFRLLFSGKEWTPLMRAMGLLEQIQQYQETEE
ncbi:hypothetical protein [Taibaiella koreensis]|uniref:hypothetical protein n=1 Tax=Taibaiella koreensis TaxID=1268548 RepID=UPI000E59ED3E|nr:hypothetical protein [Taibaiella koreensis]